MARLELRQIVKTYGDVVAVNGLSVAVEPGQILCLLGASGCGKSTTLRIAAGVEQQDAGAVLIGGQIISEGRVHAPPEGRPIGLMFQDFALFPHLSVADNVCFGLLAWQTPDSAARVQELLERVNLTGYGSKFPHQLSGGEQQRVALARALAPRPDVMLMDEPFSGLDNRLRDEVRDATLSLLKENNVAVMLVTHDPEEAMRMSDSIALMRDGRIIQTGTPYNIYNYPADRAAAAFFSDINIIRGTARHFQTETPFGPFLTQNIADGTPVEIVIRPQHLRIQEDRGTPPAANAEDGIAAMGNVVRARFIGQMSLIEVRMAHDGSMLSAMRPGLFLPEEGNTVWLQVRREHCFVFPVK